MRTSPAQAAQAPPAFCWRAPALARPSAARERRTQLGESGLERHARPQHTPKDATDTVIRQALRRAGGRGAAPARARHALAVSAPERQRVQVLLVAARLHHRPVLRGRKRVQRGLRPGRAALAWQSRARCAPRSQQPCILHLHSIRAPARGARLVWPRPRSSHSSPRVPSNRGMLLHASLPPARSTPGQPGAPSRRARPCAGPWTRPARPRSPAGARSGRRAPGPPGGRARPPAAGAPRRRRTPRSAAARPRPASASSWSGPAPGARGPRWSGGGPGRALRSSHLTQPRS